GRAGDSRGARAARHVAVPDRRPARRHERRGRAPPARGSRQAEHPSRGDDARGGEARRGARRTMSDVWSERAEVYGQSPIHAQGEDLDLAVEWCEPGPGVTVLDVATG